eukprot:s1380_g2.t1
MNKKECTRESTQCFGYVLFSLHQELWSTCSHSRSIFGGHFLQKDDILYLPSTYNANQFCLQRQPQLQSLQKQIPFLSPRQVHTLGDFSWALHGDRVLLVRKGFYMSHVQTLQAVAGDQKPLLAATSQSRDCRILGPASFLPSGQDTCKLDRTAQLIALPRQRVSMPRGFLYLFAPEHCNSVLA